MPTDRRHEVPERLSAEGDVLTPLDEDAVRRVARTLAEQDVESVALVFLFSYRQPEHEERAAELLREILPDDVPITRSSALLPEYREYERTATTVVSAYVRPTVARYLLRLDAGLGERSVRVMQSNGGTIGLDLASEQAARLALSGPAGGVVEALGIARRAMDTDAPCIMTLDMGGTSADVALCDGMRRVPPSTPSRTCRCACPPRTSTPSARAGGASPTSTRAAAYEWDRRAPELSRDPSATDAAAPSQQ